MINPGGTPGTSFSKSATTRFNNSQLNGARAAMPFNVAAQQSLRNQSSGATPSGPPVGPKQNPNDLIMPFAPEGAPAPLPTGGPALPVEQPKYNPLEFRDKTIDKILEEFRQEKFINSPRVKDAATSVRLKNFFNNSNPDRMPDSRNMLDRVLARMGLGGSQ